jgi:MinD superfamily P-loop ATPase
MIVAIASGKGGTGKTTIATALARIWDGPRVAVDMDVEAPNLHLFLAPSYDGRKRAVLDVPVVLHPEACSGCGACSRLCAFKAIIALGDYPVVFPEMCHGCGGCLEVCRRGVLGAGKRELGEIFWGRAGAADGASPDLRIAGGQLRIGEAMSVPLIRQVRTKANEMLAEHPGDVIIDAPPGTSCPALSAVREVDVLLLVAEPTPFGLHDLGLAVRALASGRVPTGVVVNRAGLGDDCIRAFCHKHDLPILAEIPFRRDIAEACAQGIPLDHMGELRTMMETLARSLRELAEPRVAA